MLRDPWLSYVACDLVVSNSGKLRFGDPLDYTLDQHRVPICLWLLWAFLSALWDLCLKGAALHSTCCLSFSHYIWCNSGWWSSCWKHCSSSECTGPLPCMTENILALFLRPVHMTALVDRSDNCDWGMLERHGEAPQTPTAVWDWCPSSGARSPAIPFPLRWLAGLLCECLLLFVSGRGGRAGKVALQKVR